MEQNFDLLGDPIPEGFGKRGRPVHLVTDEKRNKIMMLLALGWSNKRIANALSCTLPTLRKHYFRQLKARDIARDRLDATRLDLVWSLAKGGNVGAIKEFGRMIDKNDVMEAARTFQHGANGDYDATSKAAKPGKKEQAQAAAETAGQGSEWGTDLAFSGRSVN